MNECPGIGISTPSGCMIKPTSDIGGDNYTVEVITHTIDNIEVPGFRDQNDEDRKQNGDMVVTSLRQETHRSGELTDALADKGVFKYYISMFSIILDPLSLYNYNMHGSGPSTPP